MNFSAIFIKRPIATSLLALGLAIAGVVAFNLLPVAPLPQIDFPTISVQAALPGASANVMATSVATPLEAQLGRISGVTQMTSASSLGSTRIILQFDLSRDIDGAARDVQAAINAAQSTLPANLPNNPTYRKVNPADAPIMILALTSNRYTPGQMYDAASTILQQKLAQVAGIGQVFVGGGSLPAVRIELNPTALNHYGIGLTEVANSIAAANANLAKGQIVKNNKLATLAANDQMDKAIQYRPLIISYHQGSAVKLENVATVQDSIEDVRTLGLANGKPAILIVLFKQPGANVITTIDHVKEILPQLKASILPGIDINVMLDRTATIRTSLHDIEITLVIAMLLVILVTYFFLDNIRAMLIPGVAVPLSLLGTFVVMHLFNYSLDNLSLMALTISTGFVVDDTVVMLENISRHLEMGKTSFIAALDGAKEVSFTILSMTLSLIAVFIPILLMGGIVGRLFREFSVTLAIAIFVSMLISLTVTPMMCAHLLKNNKEIHSNKFIQYLQNRYTKNLKWALGHSKIMGYSVLLTLIITLILFIVIPKGFFPQQDTGRITGSIQAEQNISFEAMQKILKNYISVIRNDPDVENVVGFVGGSTVNSGSIFISLKPLHERYLSADAIINRLRPKLAKISAAMLYLQAAQDILIGGRQGNAQFQYTISAYHLKDLNNFAPQLMKALATIPGIADINSDQRDHALQVMINIDHQTAARFGIRSALIDETLYSAFGQRQISTIYHAMNQYHVVMEVAPQFWQYPQTLKEIYVKSPQGFEVPLAAFSHFTPGATLLMVNHQGQLPAATLSFNLKPGFALGDAVNAIKQKVTEIHLPSGLNGNFQGTAQAFQDSLANEIYLIMSAIFIVYIVLGILYESLIHPLTILSTLPSAGVGALLALILTRTEMSIIALIGMILLVGIVKKNAIMMVDFALALQRKEKINPQKAIFEAAILRFRPILMTTFAALLGAIPLVIAFGLGAELRRPLGIAVIGGLIVSQLLTLYTTPVIYLAIGRLGKKIIK